MKVTDLLNPVSGDVQQPRPQQFPTQQIQAQAQQQQQETQLEINNENSQLESSRRPLSLCHDVEMILSLLSCSNCGNLFTDPTTLSCGNTYCRGCLMSIAAHHTRVPCQSDHCDQGHAIIDAKPDVTVRKLADLCLKEICPDFCRAAVNSSETTSVSSCDFMTHEDPTINLDQVKTRILQELECQICYLPYSDPVTTTCGHTFCKTCLTRSIDHSDKCPLCRSRLRLSYTQVSNHLTNKTITNFLERFYPNWYADRQILDDSMEDTPIFIYSLVFPKMSCFLHVFEPQYRLMIRRCWDSQKRRFGMVLPGMNGQDAHAEYGTMLEIRSAQFLPDGCSLVEAVGFYRFRVIDWKQRDGYHVGKIERIDDISPEEEEELERQTIAAAACHNSSPENTPVNELTTAELTSLARNFIEDLRNRSTASWLLHRFYSTYGEMPCDPSDFSFWIASIIPINEHDKYRLLKLRSVRERLKLIVYWIGQLQEQWWFTKGCTIS